MKLEPWFSSRSNESTRPRLLLVSYVFPPRQAAGALRWRKLSHHLASVGWDLDVLATPPASASPDDEELRDLPEGVTVYAVSEAPGWLRRAEDGVARLVRRFRPRPAPSLHPVPEVEAGGDGGAASAPDPLIDHAACPWVPRRPRELLRLYRVFLEHEELFAWAHRAARQGHVLASRQRYGAVLASGPPWSTPMAASSIARAWNIPLILDFRDPWGLPQPALMEETAHPLGPLLWERLEAGAVRPARAVITNTPTVERAMRELYPGVHFRTILNGVDDVFPDSGARPPNPFRIIYAGTIYLDRDPRVLFRAVGRLIESRGLTPDELTVEFVGDAEQYQGVPTERLAADAGLGAHLHLRPMMPRAELLDFLKTGAILVSLPQSTPWSIPSKIYEYMGYNAGLLVFAREGSGTAEILRDSGAFVVDPYDEAGTLEVLEECHSRYLAGQAIGSPDDAERFARERTGEALLDLFDDLGLTAT